jgi:hypothetical protein
VAHSRVSLCPDSILGVSLFGGQSPEYFESFDKSFMTMFRIAGAHVYFISLHGTKYVNP